MNGHRVPIIVQFGTWRWSTSSLPPECASEKLQLSTLVIFVWMKQCSGYMAKADVIVSPLSRMGRVCEFSAITLLPEHKSKLLVLRFSSMLLAIGFRLRGSRTSLQK